MPTLYSIKNIKCKNIYKTREGPDRDEKETSLIGKGVTNYLYN